MRYLLIIGLLITSPYAIAQKNINFIHSDFELIAADHQTIAILPIEASIKLRPREMEDLSPTELYDMEQEFGFIVQSDIEHFFLNKRKKKGIPVEIRDIRETNKLLYEHGITFHNISEHSSSTIAEILNVDAVIRGNISSKKPTSEEVAGLVFEVFEIDLNTNKSYITLKLFDNSGELLWHYAKSLGLPYGSIRESTIAPLLIKGARKLPYGRAY